METVDIQPGVSKTFHLLDDSELEGSQFADPTVLTSPTNDLMPLQESHNTEDSCTLLTRYKITFSLSHYLPVRYRYSKNLVLFLKLDFLVTHCVTSFQFSLVFAIAVKLSVVLGLYCQQR